MNDSEQIALKCIELPEISAAEARRLHVVRKRVGTCKNIVYRFRRRWNLASDAMVSKDVRGFQGIHLCSVVSYSPEVNFRFALSQYGLDISGATKGYRVNVDNESLGRKVTTWFTSR